MGVAPLPVHAKTTGELLAHYWGVLWSINPSDATLPSETVQLLAPVTSNQQFICQGVNYRSHVVESGLRVKDFPFNPLFTKASSCIAAADAPVVRPAHVQLLDCEIELGLVLRRDLPPDTRIRPEDLHRCLAGVTIVNDLSARDVQLPQGQFYKGKSYRGFGPVSGGIRPLQKRTPSTFFATASFPGQATTVQFMVKDSKKYAATGGWGFGRFVNGKPASMAEHKTCFACHQSLAKNHDFVTTRYAR